MPKINKPFLKELYTLDDVILIISILVDNNIEKAATLIKEHPSLFTINIQKND